MGTGESEALEALVAYGERYQRAIRRTRLGFQPPAATADLTVVERLRGDATTDFGAPGATPSDDARELDTRELARRRKILVACWALFDDVMGPALESELRKGPRGGGRSAPAILDHVLGAEAAYLRRLAARAPKVAEKRDHRAAARMVHEASLDALSRAVTEGLPAKGPRGGKIWTVRYFIRRASWHALDHAWEIEDRLP